MDATARRKKGKVIIPQIKIHPSLHDELIKLAKEEGQTIQGTLHVILCDRFNRPELSRRTRLTALTL